MLSLMTESPGISLYSPLVSSDTFTLVLRTTTIDGGFMANDRVRDCRWGFHDYRWRLHDYRWGSWLTMGVSRLSMGFMTIDGVHDYRLVTMTINGFS